MFTRLPTPLRSTVTGLVTAALTATAVAQVPPAGPRPSPQANPPGPVMAGGTGTPKGADTAPITPSTPAVKAVQDLLGKAVTAATTAGKSHDLLGLLTKADRDRLGDHAGDWSDVDAAAESFAAAWRAKFGTSFTLADKGPIAFTEPTMHVAGLTPTTGPDTSAAAPVTVTLTGPARRLAAAVRVAPEGKDQYRIELGDAATAATLHDRVLRELKGITADQRSWPTDVDQAYVYVTQRVMSALGEPVTPR